MRPAVSSSTEEVYDALGPTLRAMAGDGPGEGAAGESWLLLEILDAGLHLLAAVEDVVRDRPDGTPGWASIADLDTAPAHVLPWLGQWVVPPAPGLPVEQLRERIRLRQNWRKGTPEHMRGVILDHLTGSRRIEIEERYGDDPLVVRIRVYEAEVVDEDRLRAAVAAAQPPLTVTLEIATGGTYAQQMAFRPTYAEQLAEWPTYADRTYWLPEA